MAYPILANILLAGQSGYTLNRKASVKDIIESSSGLLNVHRYINQTLRNK